MEINRNLSKQPFSTGSGRITLKNSLRDYFHLLKFPDFRLLVLIREFLLYFQNLFLEYLSGFRRVYGCQHVLMRITENWKLALDNKKII